MAFIPSSNSVVAFQSDPTKLVGTVSVVGNMNSSITAFMGGSWSASVTGTMSVLGTVPVTQTTTPWVVNMPSPSLIAYQAAGSILAVSGSFSSTPQNSIIALQLAGSVLAVSGSFTSGNTSVQLLGGVATIGSVVALQGGVWATSMVGGPIQVNSILGTYLEKSASVPSVIGFPMLFRSNSTTSVLTIPSTIDPLPVQGSVAVLQGTNPWVVNMPSPSVVVIHPAGSVVQVRTDNASVIAVLSNSSVTALQGTNPWQINVPSPSIIAYQLAGSVMAVNTTVTTGPSSVQLLSTSASIVTVQNYGYSSVMLMASTSASVVTLVTNQLQGVSSVQLMSTSASIATLVTNQLQGVSSVMLFGSTNASIAALVSQNTNPWIIGSIVGTYQEDSAHTSTDRGLFMLHVRNDTLSSVTTTDGDYSTNAVGPAGETVVANSPITKWTSGATSVMYGTSVQVLAAPGASIYTYITGINVINESPNISRVTITQGLGRVPASMMTWAIAPGQGGSNMTFPNPLKTVDNVGVSASISGVSSVFVTITGFLSKT